MITRTRAMLLLLQRLHPVMYDIRELAIGLGCHERQARDAIANLQRKCCIAVVMAHGRALYGLTPMGTARALDECPKKPRGNVVPYEKKPRHLWDRDMPRAPSNESLQPRDVVARVPRSIFDWRP